MVLKFSREQASRDPENYFNIRFMMFFISQLISSYKSLEFNLEELG